MRLMKFTWIGIFVVVASALWAQEVSLEGVKELKESFDGIYKQTSDEAKLAKADAFVDEFKHVLYKPQSYTYPFESFEMGKMTSPDTRFRLFNWNVNLANGREKYYALVVVKKKDRLQIIQLHDLEDEVKNVEQAVLTDKKWLGALYYEIIPVKRRGRTHYILLGWDGYSNTSNKKVIEVMSINGKGVRFGAPIFKKGKKTSKRIVFEYAEDAVMSLQYQRKKDILVFDHLAPIGNHIDSEKEFFAPDLTFDAYQFKKGKWYFVDNLTFLRPNTKKDRKFNDPRQ